MPDYIVTQHGDWQIAVAPPSNGVEFIAWAKRGRIVGPSALFEPGEVYFEFGKTACDARTRLLNDLRLTH